MECIESSGAWLVLAFHPLRLRLSRVSAVILEALGSGAKRAEKGLPRVRRWHRRDRSPFSLSRANSRVLVWWMRPGFLLSCSHLAREKRDIGITYIPDTCLGLAPFAFSCLPCDFIRRDETRFLSRCGFSPLFLSPLRQRRCVRVKLTSFNTRFNQDGRCPVNVSAVTSLLRCYANWYDWMFLIVVWYILPNSVDQKFINSSPFLVPMNFKSYCFKHRFTYYFTSYLQ